MRITLLTIIVILPKCIDNQCYFSGFQNVTSYEVSQTGVTAKGIKLDDPNGLLNVEKLDSFVTQVEKCLDIMIKSNCITVKVPLDLYQSPCTGKLLFPCSIDEQICRDKGLEPTKECPCNCRGAIQDENIIVIEPTLEIFKGELVQIMTGISNPWTHLRTSRCL